MKGVIAYHVPRYLQELYCFHKMFCFNEAGKASFLLKYVLRLKYYNSCLLTNYVIDNRKRKPI